MKTKESVMNIYRTCPMCGTEHSFALTFPEIITLEVGNGLIQRDLPELAPQEREFLITGYCLDCQEALFGTKYTDQRNANRWDCDDTEPVDVEVPDQGSLIPSQC